MCFSFFFTHHTEFCGTWITRFPPDFPHERNKKLGPKLEESWMDYPEFIPCTILTLCMVTKSCTTKRMVFKHVETQTKCWGIFPSFFLPSINWWFGFRPIRQAEQLCADLFGLSGGVPKCDLVSSLGSWRFWGWKKPWKNRWKKPWNRCGNPMKSHGFSGKIHQEGVGVPNLC